MTVLLFGGPHNGNVVVAHEGRLIVLHEPDGGFAYERFGDVALYVGRSPDEPRRAPA